MTNLFKEFFDSERSAGITLIVCTILSITLANYFIGQPYISFWHLEISGNSIEFWINDGLMTFFFLLVGLEIERELYIGELSDFKKSTLPIVAAIGGMMMPALIHLSLNHGTDFQSGFGIPMATDIAFALAILSLLGTRVPVSLKIFLTALAIIDDLGAILLIAIFYSRDFSFIFLGLGAFVFIILLLLNQFNVNRIWPYILLGIILWVCVYKSGIHPTITGILIAFTIPFRENKDNSPSYTIQHHLHKPVAFFILPLFALANTAIIFPSTYNTALLSSNNLGIILGLVFGKPLGILLFSMVGILSGFCSLPDGMKKKHIIWSGFLAGIGFTMSIFITLLAFSESQVIALSKIAVILGSLSAAIIGYLGLLISLKSK